MNFFRIFALSLFLLSCGRYAPPLPPENFAPSSVRALAVVPAEKTLDITWTAPDKDAKGQKLKSINGYHIYRAQGLEFAPKKDAYELLTTIEDTHLKELKERQEAALEKDAPARRLKPQRELTIFKFTDSDIISDGTYYYRIVPFNQYNVEGPVDKTARVHFLGTKSEVALVDEATLAEDIEDNES